MREIGGEGLDLGIDLFTKAENQEKLREELLEIGFSSVKTYLQPSNNGIRDFELILKYLETVAYPSFFNALEDIQKDQV